MPRGAGHDDRTCRIPPKMKKSVYKMLRTCNGREACEGKTHVCVHGPNPPVQFGPLTVRSRPRPARKPSHPGAYSGARRLLGIVFVPLACFQVGCATAATLYCASFSLHAECSLGRARRVFIAANLHRNRTRKRRSRLRPKLQS